MRTCFQAVSKRITWGEEMENHWLKNGPVLKFGGILVCLYFCCSHLLICHDISTALFLYLNELK